MLPVVNIRLSIPRSSGTGADSVPATLVPTRHRYQKVPFESHHRLGNSKTGTGTKGAESGSGTSCRSRMGTLKTGTGTESARCAEMASQNLTPAPAAVVKSAQAPGAEPALAPELANRHLYYYPK